MLEIHHISQYGATDGILGTVTQCSLYILIYFTVSKQIKKKEKEKEKDLHFVEENYRFSSGGIGQEMNSNNRKDFIANPRHLFLHFLPILL